MKQVVFIQVGTGLFSVELDQVERFVDNAEILDFSSRRAVPSIMGLLRYNDKVIPLLDPYTWFGQNRMNFYDKRIFIVMTFRGKSFAFQISNVIGSVEVPSECFHMIPAIYNRKSRGAFREVIEWDGTLYLQINAETVLKEMMTSTKISG